MRILIFTWRDVQHPKAGGAEVYTHEISRHWVQSGHQVTVFCAKPTDDHEDKIIDGVQYIRRGSHLSVYRHARKFYESEARGKFDVAIDQINTRPFFGHRFVNDIPVVAFLHQVAREIWFYETNWFLAVVGRFVLEPMWLRRYRDIPVLTVSKSSQDSLAKYGLPNSMLVPEGIDPIPDLQESKKEPVPTFLFCGRLSPNKRPDHVLKAFALIKKKIPDAQLWFVGSGPMEKKLKGSASDSVSFFGRVSQEEKYNIMARAHALLVSSVREGWGLVVSEAASAGTPTIGYDVPGLRDSIDAAHGVLVLPNIEALAFETTKLFCRPDWQTAMPPPSTSGTESWEQVSVDFLTKLQQIIAAYSSYVDIRDSLFPAEIDVNATAGK